MSEVWIDHKGRKFKTTKAMCKFWGVDPSTFSYRMKMGYSLELALTALPHEKCRGKLVEDHLGNKFNSVKEMIEYWGVSTPFLFYLRKKKGCSLEECLTGIQHPAYDHKGNRFNSVSDMIKHYHIAKGTYYTRKNKGWTLEECLLGKVV